MADDSRDAVHESSHWGRWVPALVAAPVIYLLTLPPLIMHSLTTSPDSVPRWIEVYVGPANWLHDHTLLRDPMDAYMNWWIGIILDEDPTMRR